MTEFVAEPLGLAAVAVLVVALGHRREVADRLAAAVRWAHTWWEGLPASELDVRAAARRHRGEVDR